MPTPLTKSSLDTLKILLRYESPSVMYDALEQFGYNYSALARGMMDKSSPSGSAAVNFLRLTAQREGRPLPDHMVRKYLRPHGSRLSRCSIRPVQQPRSGQ